MSDTTLLTIIIIQAVLLLVIFIHDAIQSSDEKIRTGLRHKKRWTSDVSKAALVRSVVRFSEPILHQSGIYQLPEIKISYHPSKKWMGWYNGNHNVVRIYVNNHNNIPDLVNTVLHEICHHIQNHDHNGHFRYYDDYQETYGYFNNPLEVDSRAFADRWTHECLVFLKNENVICLR